MTITELSDIYYDPYDRAIDADPHPVWQRMRDESPVYYNEKFDFYALTRFEDVQAASSDWETYSSAKGSVMEIIRSPEALAMSRSLLFMDPPEHTQFRSLIGRRFTPRQAAKMENNLRAICATLLDQFKPGDTFDYIQDFGALLPMKVICAFMGVPVEDHDDIRRLADMLVHRPEGETDPSADVHATVAAYFAGAVALRRVFPRDDFITDLAVADLPQEDGSTRKLDEGEVLRFLTLVAGGGNETVTRFLSWAVTLLAQHPDQRQMLADDPSLIPNAIEEIIRIEAPTPVQARLTTREINLHGIPIPEGSVVLLLTNTANRDERQFPNPDQLDITRNTDQHLGFGFGVHFCVGAALARLEARMALEETLKRFPTWDIDWDNLEMVHTSTVRGYSNVPIFV